MCRTIFKMAGFLLLLATWACNGLVVVNDPNGQLFVKVTTRTHYGVKTKSLDVDSFVFILTTAEGDTLYNSTVGEVTGEPFSLRQGTYTITVCNEWFTVPAFEKPFYYNQTQVHVVAGSACNANIVCTQHNAGVRVLFTENYLNSSPESHMIITGSDGELLFEKTTEHLWGYYNPGPVILMLYKNNIQSRSFERTIDANHMYTFLVDAPDTLTQYVEPVFSITTDTTRVWHYGIWDDEHYDNNEFPDGLTKETACSITQARTLPDNIGDIWVYGYIVGCYLSNRAFAPGETSVASNLALADNPDEQIKENTYSIELKSGTSVRNALNLMDNPENLNKKVWLKGTINHSYMDIHGLKNVKEYSW